MKKNYNEQTEILLALHKIEYKLQEIVDILKIGNRETINAIQRRALEGSFLRKKIYGLCDGKRSVSQIAKILDNRSVQQISNNMVILQNAGLVKEIRKGKEKYYVKTG
ncbi:MAG: helix-turn-helix domain-containing protein [Candidatus Aenigmatarchaeota archaeon]